MLAGLGVGLPRLGRAAVSASDRKFVFLFARGGWDPLGVFSPQFGIDTIEMEAGTGTGVAGNIQYVDSLARPSVKQFFDNYYDRAAIFNGMLVRSVNHEVCRRLVLTGNSDGTYSDWGSIIGSHQRDRYITPNLIVSGPCNPGQFADITVFTGFGDQLESLFNETSFDRGNTPLIAPSASAQVVMDAYVTQRGLEYAGQATTQAHERMASVFNDALYRGDQLKLRESTLDFTTGNSLSDMADIGVEALSSGIARCVMMATDGWDTHASNALQSSLYEDFFKGINDLMYLLNNTPGSVGNTLADETVVCVMSEMGRPPYLSGSGGKDHWPYTSFMLLGPGVQGNQVVGAYDEYLSGVGMDPATGSFTTGDLMSIKVEHLGATLLALADIDPEKWTPGISPLYSMLT